MQPDAVYPLDKPLSASLIEQRIVAFNPILHAIRHYRNPLPKKEFHVLVKNNIGLEGFKTSAGSKLLEDLHLEDAFCVKQLKTHEVDIFGTTNMTEMAGFVTSTRSESGYSEIGGFPQNPYGACFAPRGSSAGSAVAVAAGFCDAALGTETRGSVSLPGLANGVYAFKPSRGSISRSGIIPLSFSLDAPGIFARTIETIRALWKFMAAEDPNDEICKSFYAKQHSNPGRQGRKTLGLVHSKDLDPAEKKQLARAKEKLLHKGVEIVLIEDPSPTFDYKEISSLEFISGMNRFLSLHKDQLEVSDYQGFISYYRKHPDTHPYGMDRLEDALKFPRKPTNALKELVQTNIDKAQATVRELMEEFDLDALGSTHFIDWWSIGGGPSITLPLEFATREPPLSIMIGSSFGMDERLLDFSEALSSPRKK